MEVFNWKSFISNVSLNGVVPVIGNDLSMVRFNKEESPHLSDIWTAIQEKGTEDGDYIRINLYDYLALKVWDAHGIGDVPESTLNKVVLRLQKQGIGEDIINNFIKKQISDLTDRQIFLEPYRKLARIKGFETILTVNTDNFLERAFEAEGISKNAPVNYSIPEATVDPDYRNDLALVSIYNLMGNIGGHNFAVTEEQSLEYMYMLQKGMDTGAKDLFDAIRGKAILLVGCSFPDWFMRFFIRIISRERLKGGIKTKYVACDRTLQDSELAYFLENNSIKIVPIGTLPALESNGNEEYRSSVEFIDKMYREWKKKLDTGGQGRIVGPRFKEKIFLSYSRDDQIAVERLKNEFEKNGVNVFFDKNSIPVGRRFDEVIKKQIRDCDYFLPIISRNAISDKNRYVHKEWKIAMVLNEFKDESYIRPYIIDDTAPTDERIPEEFRSLNIATISSAIEIPVVVRKFNDTNNLTRIAS